MGDSLGDVASTWSCGMGVGGALGSSGKNMKKANVFQSQSMNIATMAHEMVADNEDARALIKIKMEAGFLKKKTT
jgi:hypothetical protein